LADAQGYLELAVEWEEAAENARNKGNVDAANEAEQASIHAFETALSIEQGGEEPPGLVFQVGPNPNSEQRS
jgi:hypothetical protein